MSVTFLKCVSRRVFALMVRLYDLCVRNCARRRSDVIYSGSHAVGSVM